MKLKLPPLWLVFVLAGVLLFLLLFLVGFGGNAFDSVVMRVGIDALVSAPLVFFGLGLWFLQRMREAGRGKGLLADLRRNNESQVAAAAPGQQRENLKAQSEKWAKNLDRLRKACLNVYEHPFYVLIGEPGSGKTTTLRECGLPFPPDGRVAGLGGTRDCDWFFFDGATVLDTAGRWTVSDSPQGDPGWFEFLKSLRRARPRCPINGVVVVVPVTSLLDDSPELVARKATEIRAKLSELQNELGMQVPAHLLITKADKVPGFVEFFSFLDDDERQQLVGWAPEGDPYAPFDTTRFPELFQQFVERLSTAENRALLHHFDREGVSTTVSQFPSAVGRIQRSLQTYVDTIFRRLGIEEGSIFRGFFFSSGVQDERSLEKLFGPAGAKPRAYFVRDFYQHRVFPERGLARPSTIRERRNERTRTMLLAGAAVAVTVVLFLGLALAFADTKDVRSFASVIDAKRLRPAPPAPGTAAPDAWAHADSIRDAWLELEAGKTAGEAGRLEGRKGLLQAIDTNWINRVVYGAALSNFRTSWDTALEVGIVSDWLQAVALATKAEVDAADRASEAPQGTALDEAARRDSIATAQQRFDSIQRARTTLQTLREIVAGKFPPLPATASDPNGGAPAPGPEPAETPEARDARFWNEFQLRARPRIDAAAQARIARFSSDVLVQFTNRVRALRERGPREEVDLAGRAKGWRANAETWLFALRGEMLEKRWADQLAFWFEPRAWQKLSYAQLASEIRLAADVVRGFENAAKTDTELGTMPQPMRDRLRGAVELAANSVPGRISKDLKGIAPAVLADLADDLLYLSPVADPVTGTKSLDWARNLWKRTVREHLDQRFVDQTGWRVASLVISDLERLSSRPMSGLVAGKPSPFLDWSMEPLRVFLESEERRSEDALSADLQRGKTREGSSDLIGFEELKQLVVDAMERTVVQFRTIHGALDKSQSQPDALHAWVAYEYLAGSFLHLWLIDQKDQVDGFRRLGGGRTKTPEEVWSNVFGRVPSLGGIARVVLSRFVDDLSRDLEKRRRDAEQGGAPGARALAEYFRDDVKAGLAREPSADVTRLLDLQGLSQLAYDYYVKEKVGPPPPSGETIEATIAKAQAWLAVMVRRHFDGVVDAAQASLSNYEIDPDQVKRTTIRDRLSVVDCLNDFETQSKTAFRLMAEASRKIGDTIRASAKGLLEKQFEWVLGATAALPQESENTAKALVKNVNDRVAGLEITEESVPLLEKALANAYQEARDASAAIEKGESATFGASLQPHAKLAWVGRILATIQASYVGAREDWARTNLKRTLEEIRGILSACVELRPFKQGASQSMSVEQVLELRRLVQAFAEVHGALPQKTATYTKTRVAPTRDRNLKPDDVPTWVAAARTALSVFFERESTGATTKPHVFRVALKLDFTDPKNADTRQRYLVEGKRDVLLDKEAMQFVAAPGSDMVWELSATWSLPPRDGTGRPNLALVIVHCTTQTDADTSLPVVWNPTENDCWPFYGRLSGRLGGLETAPLSFGASLPSDDRDRIAAFEAFARKWSNASLSFDEGVTFEDR